MTNLPCSSDSLGTLPFFSALSEGERQALVPAVQHRSYAARECLVRAGENVEGLYIMLTGRANVVLDDEHGRRIIVAAIGPGEMAGEIALFDAALPPMQIEAQEACEVLFVPRASALAVLEQNPTSTMLMLRLVAKRLGEAQRKIGNLGLLDVYGRVASVLLDCSREADGHWLVEPGAERIAAMVGASREMVSRVVKDMIARGVVRRFKRKLVILDRAGLMQRRVRQKRIQESSGATAPSGRLTVGVVGVSPCPAATP